MKKILLVLLVLSALPLRSIAQDDLYFVPKKKVEKKVTTGTPAKVVVDDKAPTSVYKPQSTPVVVKDVTGEVRDLDEYNRRYTSRDNTFEFDNDTLYINEKPFNERGEWVNGFEGTQDDYEYAMRIIRFRNPRYAIPISSPIYWDVVYSLPSWEWNVFNDGYYAYAFPTFTNTLWWDWRWNHLWNNGWLMSSNWYSPWYNSWYGPGYWNSYYHYHWYPHWHHHHHYGPIYAGIGGYWGGGHGYYGSTAHKPGIHAGRYVNTSNRNSITNNNRRQVATTTSRGNRDTNVNARQSRRNNAAVNRGNSTQSVRNVSRGRVVRSNDRTSSVRPQTSEVNRQNDASVRNRTSSVDRTKNSYVRSEGKGSSYNRPSSTRSSVKQNSSNYQKKNSGTTYRSNSSTGNTRNSSTYRSNNSSSRSYGNSYSGSSSRSSSSGVSRSSGGGSSRGTRR